MAVKKEQKESTSKGESTSKKASANPHSLDFTIVDFFQVSGSFLALNFLLSYFFTSSLTWGYHGHYLDFNYYKFKINHFNSYLNLTDSELALFNGSDPSLPIYVSVNDKIFDVSSSRKTYGPKGTYGFLSGKDVTRVFLTGCIGKKDEYTYDLRGIDENEIKEKWINVERWESFYEKNPNYWTVGYTIHDKELTGDPPTPCKAGATVPNNVLSHHDNSENPHAYGGKPHNPHKDHSDEKSHQAADSNKEELHHHHKNAHNPHKPNGNHHGSHHGSHHGNYNGNYHGNGQHQSLKDAYQKILQNNNNPGKAARHPGF
ncbi:cytochrome b5 [Ascoidea rubescens DSM 1968]|uniref:Cytochrome b5 n=1 Tax=Ascoidea rubescens DSM 1968 TaxID=1344418 RepID=A0A1D2VAE4_9ASCO|nr:cytochrome b5 [Ascoidea rubescens DSM 1968]ODV58559.1 cytochrome b5 [Ascoidea rubescens DSM 1968]